MNVNFTTVGPVGQRSGSTRGKAGDSSHHPQRGIAFVMAFLVAAATPWAPLRAADRPDFARLKPRVFASLRADAFAENDAVCDLAFSPDGNTLATCGVHCKGGQDTTAADYDVGQIKLWDVRTAKARAIIAEKGIANFMRMALSPDGRTIVSGSYDENGSNDGTIDFWDVTSGRHLRQVKWPGTIIHSLAISGDGRFLAAGGYRGAWVQDSRMLRIIDMQSGKDLARLEDGFRLVSLAFSSDDKLLVAAHCDGRTRVLEVGNWSLRREFRSGGGLCSVALCPVAGHQLAAVTPVAHLVNRIVVLDYLTGQCIRALKGNTADVGCMAFSRDGALLALGETSLISKPIASGEPAFSSSLKVCDIRNGALITIATSLDTLSRVAFSPSGDHLACCTDDGLLVWKLK